MPLLPSRLLSLLDALHLRVPLRTAVFGTQDFFRRLRIPFIRRTIRRLEARKRAELRATGRKIKVCFACIDKSQWIFQSVYDAFRSDPHYEVSILRCKTWVRNNDKGAADELRIFLEDRGMPTVGELDEKNLPDIMFLPRFDPLAYAGIFDPCKLYKKVLFCLSIYAWITHDCDQFYFGNLNEAYLWKYFMFNDRDAKVCALYKILPKADIVTVGFPRNDENATLPMSPHIWKQKSTVKIIWAPHWSVLTHGYYGNFDRYAYPLLEWLRTHPAVEITLKPHPLLRARLTDPATIQRFKRDNPRYKDPDTFKTPEEFDTFMSQWDALPNGHVMNSGGYAELFATSDAMLLDSGSFIAEYMYLNKPMCFCNRRSSHEELLSTFNEFGRDLFTGMEIADSLADIEKFFDNVANGIDPLKDARAAVRAKYLTVNDGHVGSAIKNYVEQKLVTKP